MWWGYDQICNYKFDVIIYNKKKHFERVKCKKKKKKIRFSTTFPHNEVKQVLEGL